MADQELEKKVHVQVEALVTVLLHVAVQIRVRIYKNKSPIPGNGVTPNSKGQLLASFATNLGPLQKTTILPNLIAL